MLEEFDALVEGTPQSHGKFLKKPMTQCFRNMTKLLTRSMKSCQHRQLKEGYSATINCKWAPNIVSVKSCRIACASENCVGGNARRQLWKLTPSVTSTTNFTNNYICLDNGKNEWLCFTMKKRPKMWKIILYRQ